MGTSLYPRGPVGLGGMVCGPERIGVGALEEAGRVPGARKTVTGPGWSAA